MCVPKKKTQLRGKLKLKMPRDREGEKLQTVKGNFGLHVACCILPNMKFHMHILKMPQPSTCGSHVAANGIHESVCMCVCVSKGAETNAFSRNFIHKDFILLYIVQLKATTRRRTAGRPKAKRTERRTDRRGPASVNSMKTKIYYH